MRRVTLLEIMAVVLVLAASVGLRLSKLDVFVAPDEMRWTCRSLEFRDALRRSDWGNTFRVGHPGVLTTWLGALFIPRDDARALSTCQVTNDASRLLRAGETVEEQGRLLAELRRLLFRARVGVALFTGLCIFGIYLLARLLWGAKIALVGLALVALDPFYLALSRFLHVDAVLASTMVLSVLSLLASLRYPRHSTSGRLLLLVSGAAGGLAALQKTPGAFTAPFAALLLAIHALRRGLSRETLAQALLDSITWGLAAGVIYIACWPAMWVAPGETLQKVLDKAVGYAVQGHENDLYFLGRPVHDPGWGFYPVATLFRLTPLATIGLASAFYWLMRRDSSEEWRFDLAALLLYSALLGVFMSWGAKKFDRYLLPAFPALDIVAAVGLLEAARGIRTRIQERGLFNPSPGASSSWALTSITYLITLAIQIALILPNSPYYLTYYNPLLGGLRRARQVLLVGWGEGYDKATAYLNAKPNAEQLQAVAPSTSAFAPLFIGDTKNMVDYTVWQTDYVVFYLSHVQRLRYPDVLERYFFDPQLHPEHVVTLRGVEYVWIYRNTRHVEPMDYIDERAKPGEECLLANGDSLFAKHYQGDIPLYGFYYHWGPEEMGKFLDEAPAGCERFWYARYPEADDELLNLVETRSLILEKKAFPHIEAILYQPHAPNADREEDLRFEKLQLRGYGLTDPPPAWGQDGGVFLDWRALQPMEEDYTAFLHLYDAHGHRIAQEDRLITDRYLRPTSRWEPGASGVALYHLPIPPGTPPGQYELELGVYLLETGKRLPLLDSDGQPQSTAARLEIRVGVPPQAPRVGDLNIPHPSEQELTPQLRLLGCEVSEEALLAGQTIHLRLFWQAAGKMGENYRLQLGLRSPEGRLYGQSELDLLSTDYPTSRWQPGELLHDRYDLPTNEEAPTGEMTVELNLLSESGQPISTQPVELAKVWLQSTQSSFDVPAAIEERYEVNLGNQITLLGYDLEAEPVRPGETAHVTVYWQAQRELEKSYKVFVHMYDREGNIVAQQDWLPGLGVKPTTEWEAGEVVADRHIVPVNEEVAAGEYAVAVGLYDEESGERLAAFGPNGERLSQDRVLLGKVRVILP